jgi:VanZ family protein
MSSSFRLRQALILWGPVAFLLGVFSVESQQFMSVAASTGPVQHIYEIFFGRISEQHWLPIYAVLRKVGHFSGYGLFSAVFFRALYLKNRASGNSLRNLHGYAVLATALAGSLDELHQCFLPGRNGCFEDVAIDTTGAVLAQLILLLIFSRISLREEAPEEI